MGEYQRRGYSKLQLKLLITVSELTEMAAREHGGRAFDGAVTWKPGSLFPDERADTVSRALSNLEERGLVQRVRRGQRTTKVRLTQTGMVAGNDAKYGRLKPSYLPTDRMVVAGNARR